MGGLNLQSQPEGPLGLLSPLGLSGPLGLGPLAEHRFRVIRTEMRRRVVGSMYNDYHKE